MRDAEVGDADMGVGSQQNIARLQITMRNSLFVSRFETFADFNCGCLACAIRPQQTEALSAVHVEIEAVHGNHVLVLLAESAHT